MAKDSTTTELRRIQRDDLRREIRGQQLEVTNRRLAVRLGGEKNTALARRARRQLARMRTIEREKKAEELMENTVDSTLGAPSPKQS